MQPVRIKPHAKEHTHNPVQRPNFRGRGTKKGTPKDYQSRGLDSRKSIRKDRIERNQGRWGAHERQYLIKGWFEKCFVLGSCKLCLCTFIKLYQLDEREL